MTTLKVNHLPTFVPLGNQDENGVKSVRIDCSPWLNKWPDLQVSVWATIPGRDSAYQVHTHMEETVVVWDVADEDTQVPGMGSMEVLGLIGDKRKLSATTHTVVGASLFGGCCMPPEAQQPWYVNAMYAAQRAEEAAAKADEAAQFAAQGGGYYTPTVDADGNLSWSANDEDMPELPTTNIKGPKGDGSDIDLATDDEIIAEMLSLGALPVLTDDNGTIYTDEAGAILLI